MSDLKNLVRGLNNIKDDAEDGFDLSAGAEDLPDLGEDFSFDSLEMPHVDLDNLMNEENASLLDDSANGRSRSGSRQISRVNTYRASPAMLLETDEPAPAPKKRRMIVPSDDDPLAFQMPDLDADDLNGAQNDLPSLKAPAGLPSLKAPKPEAKSDGLPSLKVPVFGAKSDGLPSLKVPGTGPKADGLPSLKAPGTGPKADGLPSLKAPGTGSKADGLPSLKAPGMGSNADGLPSPKVPGFGSKSDGLPSLKAPVFGAKADGLPSPKVPGYGSKSDELPSLKAPVFGAKADGLPSPKVPGFGAKSDELPSLKAPVDNLPSFKDLFADEGIDDVQMGSSQEFATPDKFMDDIGSPAGNINKSSNPVVPELVSSDVHSKVPGFSKSAGSNSAERTKHPSLFASPQLDNAFSTRLPDAETKPPAGMNLDTSTPVGDMGNDIAMPSDLFAQDLNAASSKPSDKTPPVEGGSRLRRISMRDVLNESGLGVPKLKLQESEQPVIRGKRHPTGAFDESYALDNDSGLPVSDDPLGLFDNHAPGADSNSPGNMAGADVLNLFANGEPELQKPENKNSLSSAAGVTSLNNVSQMDVGNSQFDVSRIPAPIEAKDEINEQDEQLFDIQSIQSDRKPQAAEAKSDSVPKSRKKTSRVLLAACLAVVVIASLGVAFYNNFMAEDAEPQNQVVLPTDTQKISLSWPMVESDQLAGYTRYYKQSLSKLKEDGIQAAERQEIQGKILILFALASTRYASTFADDIDMIEQSVSQISESCDGEWCALGLWSWGVFRDNEALVKQVESKITAQDDLKRLVQAARLYQKYQPEVGSFEAWTKAGNDILAALPENAEFVKEWPLATWLRAKTLATLGRYSDAVEVLNAAYPDDESLKNPAAIALKSEILLALEQNAAAKDVADKLRKMDAAAPEERDRALRVSMLASGSLEDWSAIEPVLVDFLKTSKANPIAPEIGADLCIRLNRIKSCRPVFHSISELDAKNADVRKAYITLLLHTIHPREIVRPSENINESIYSQAGQIIDSGIQLAKDSKQLWAAKGMLDYAAAQYDSANKAFDEVERGTEMVWSGSFLRLVNGWDQADEAGKKEIVQNLLAHAKDVTNADDVVILAETLIYLGQEEAAGRLIERARGLHPESTPLLNEQFDFALLRQDKALAESVSGILKSRRALLSDHEYGLAQLTEKLGDINAALESMLVLMNREKDNPEYIYYVGQLFFKQGHYESALKYFGDTLEIDSSRAWAHFYRGRALFELGRYDEALLAFDNAYSQDDTNYLFRLWNGLALEKAGRSQEALRAYTSVIDAWMAVNDKALSNVNAHDAAEAFYHRAEIIKLQNRRSDAQRDFNTALELEPDNAIYMAGYAVFMYESQQLKSAIEYLDKAEAIYGQKMDARLCFVKGLTLLKLNKRDNAVKYFEAARDRGFAELSDSDIQGVREPAEVYERLGYLYRDMGRKEDAKKSLRLFLDKSQSLSPSARLEVQREIDKI